MSQSQRVYCLSCGQSFIQKGLEKCSLCGKTGTVLDPDDPVALRDVYEKKQKDTRGLPQTMGEWIWSFVDTCLAAPWTTLAAIVALGLLGVGIALLIMQAREEIPVAFEAVAWAFILVAIAKLCFLGFFFRTAWKRVLAQTAADKFSRKVDNST
jgi:hypothetical protein